MEATEFSVLLVHAGSEADPDVVAALGAFGARLRVVDSADAALAALASAPAETVIVEASDDDGAAIVTLANALPAATWLVAIGDLHQVPHDAGAPPPACLLFPAPDEDTLRGALTRGPTIEPAQLVTELLGASVFGRDLPTTLQDLARRLTRAFGADNCVILLPEEATAYTAHQVSDDELTDLAPLCETIHPHATTVIAPARPDRPYRAFLGVPLAHDSAPPLALVLLCRVEPVPFGPEALGYLRGLAPRLSSDLSWRLVHERLLSDRDKLRSLSRIDPVLGVANRTALQEELARRLAIAERAGESFSVAVIDVDGLRLINERSGYPAGDEVLAHIARVARREARPQDIVARYAGDSVAVCFPGVGTDEATALLTRILSAIDAAPVVHEDEPIHLTVSAGVAALRYDVDTGESALGRAMAARERARLHGEVIVVADAAMTEVLARPDFESGTTLGGVYQIRHEISRGAFGVVYRAEDLALGRQVALKLLRPDLVTDAAFVEGFRAEAATLARIRNPNFVQVYAFGVESENVYFAMELVEGQGLDAKIQSAQKRRRHLLLPEVISIIDQVANALEAVHRAGMLHRDVKPDNILTDRIYRRCVLVDLGIAVRRGEKHAAGTPGYTAPEVFNQTSESPATDVYSLGALAYTLLTLQAPFAAGSLLEILDLQARRPRPLTALRRDLPPELDEVVLAALDPDPTQRPQSAKEFARALADVLEHLSVQPRRTLETVAVAPEIQRRVTMNNPGTRGPTTQPPATPSTRGVLFRAAYEILGARRGRAWAEELTAAHPELANALAPQSSSLAWHPTASFLPVLDSLSADPAERERLARQLGRTAIDMSFGQFYGADPMAVSPTEVLRAVSAFWRAYHSWGTATVIAHRTIAEVTVTDGVASALLCTSTAGLLTGAVMQAGGLSAQVDHPVCRARGADRCSFSVAWRLGTERTGPAPR